MNIVVEKQPKCVATLRVEIPAEKVKTERDQIINAYASQARVPGFRPGKAPRAVIEKRFAKEIADELNDKLVNSAYDEALTQNEDLRVLDFGSPPDLDTAPDGGLSFHSTLVLAPEITLPEYKGIAVTVPTAAVPDADLQAELQALQERFADFQDITDRAATAGDFAVIDYTSTVEGKPTEEYLGKPAGYIGGRDGFWVRLDEKAFLPGFTAQLEGMKPGDNKTITITLPDDFPLEDLCGKEIVFDTTMNELKSAILPELDDTFAAKLLPNSSMEALTDLIRSNMEDERKRRIDEMKVNQIIAALVSQVDCELPEDLVTQEAQKQADEMVDRGLRGGMSEEDIQSQQAEILASASHQAASNLRSNFILQEIARAENIEVSDTELINHLTAVAAQRKEPLKKFIKQLSRDRRLPSIRNSIRIGKTIDFLVEHAKVTESDEKTESDS